MNRFVALFLFAVFSHVAQAGIVTDEVFLNGSSVFAGSAGDSTITFETDTVTDIDTGISFRLRFVGTAPVGGIVFPSTDLGVEQTLGADQFDAIGDSITFDTISISNFNDNGSGLTAGNITNFGFTDVSFNAAGAGTDIGTINLTPFAGPGSTPILITGAPASSVTITYTSGSYRLDSLGFTATVSAVPEPASLSVLMFMGLALVRTRKRSKS